MRPGKHGLGPRVAVVRDDHGHPGPDGTQPSDERAVAVDERPVTDPDARDVGDRAEGSRPTAADDDAQVACAHGASVAPAAPAGSRGPLAYHRRVTATLPPISPGRAGPGRPPTVGPIVLERRPDLDAIAPMDLAEVFRDLPGLAVLESARPGRKARWSFVTADPIAVLEGPASGPDPFAGARALLGRLDPSPPGSLGRSAPPFLGGLVGYLGYDLGHALERLPTIAEDDQDLPILRLALHDWAIAWDRRGGRAWLAGRAVDGDRTGLGRRFDAVRRRLDGIGSMRPTGMLPPGELAFRSSLDRTAYEAGVEAIRTAIARGDIYQANLARRLETPFRGDPWPLYRALRTGDPALFAAFLDLGPGGEPGDPAGAPRAIASASPEPFLAVDRSGRVEADPIKGTRRRGRTPEEDRALAAELLASAKDRAENVMIVDVLRNDLGRVCRPGSVRVPRLCRLERTAAVQHLVSTVTGRLAPGRDAFDLLAASFPGGSITGAPKIRAMEILEELEPVRRGPYTGAALWIGPDGALGSSILIRTFVADGHAADAPRRGRDHLAERPGRRVGRDRGQGRRAAPGDRRHGGRLSMASWVWLDGRLVDAAGPHLRVDDRGFQLGDGIFETARARRGVVVELEEHLERLHESATTVGIRLPVRRRRARPRDRRAPRRGVAGRDRRRRSGTGRRIAPDHRQPGSARAPRVAPAGR